jgi:hypothetical protein
MDDELRQTGIRLRSLTRASIYRQEVKKMECELYIGTHGLEKFSIREKEKTTDIKVVAER